MITVNKIREALYNARQGHFLRNREQVSQVVVISKEGFSELMSDDMARFGFVEIKGCEQTIEGWPLVVDPCNKVKDGFQVYNQVIGGE